MPYLVGKKKPVFIFNNIFFNFDQIQEQKTHKSSLDLPEQKPNSHWRYPRSCNGPCKNIYFGIYPWVLVVNKMKLCWCLTKLSITWCKEQKPLAQLVKCWPKGNCWWPRSDSFQFRPHWWTCYNLKHQPDGVRVSKRSGLQQRYGWLLRTKQQFPNLLQTAAF